LGATQHFDALDIEVTANPGIDVVNVISAVDGTDVMPRRATLV